ncbi:hypothetical protein [Streptomyces sp. NPDC059949]|uniref:hypothetical protein n=1 Tax=Streptomyces sp. NPDC059949 TaxID=3347013 RepID=UPI00365F5B40
MNATRAVSDTTAPAGTGGAGAPYGMRPLTTAADRAVAAALVEDRARWLALRGITVPRHHVAAYRAPRAEAVGLFEVGADGEEQLAGCLLLHRQSQPRFGNTESERPGLRVSLAYTAPDRGDAIGSLITLWAGDFAARTGAETVRGEAPASHTGGGQSLGRLLDHLTTSGWRITGTGHNADGERVARLEIRAEARRGLDAMVHCTVPLHAAGPALNQAGSR